MCAAVNILAQRAESLRAAGVPDAPVYRPTTEEFADTCAYLRKCARARARTPPWGAHFVKLTRCHRLRISAEAQKYGVCKVIPPTGWAPPTAIPDRPFSTRQQALHHLKVGRESGWRRHALTVSQEGRPYADGKDYTPSEYKVMADAFAKEWMPQLADGGADADAAAKAIEQAYWRIVDGCTPEVTVEYGNDTDTSKYGTVIPLRRAEFAELRQGQAASVPCDFGSREYYKNTGWNMGNIALLPGSVLRYVREAVVGINVPWLYFGMLYATFAWHVEDNHLNSIQ